MPLHRYPVSAQHAIGSGLERTGSSSESTICEMQESPSTAKGDRPPTVAVDRKAKAADAALV
ncbi:MAG TPA: hypothetical protein VEQ10_12605 [Vicinamibacteria bacterium]|nr:hypothetical protein [Vicinamibacteria bacterium]